MSIFRPMTDAEKQEMVDINGVRKRTPKDKYMMEREKVSLKYRKKFMPYCEACARDAWDDVQDAFAKEVRRAGGDVDFAAVAKKLALPDLEIYGDVKRFAEGDHQEAVETTLVGTSKINKKIGYHVDYLCTGHTGMVSVFVPLDVYDERYKPVVADKPETAAEKKKREAEEKANK